MRRAKEAKTRERQGLLAHGRRVRTVEDLDDHVIRAIERAEVPAKFNHLNRILRVAIVVESKGD